MKTPRWILLSLLTVAQALAGPPPACAQTSSYLRLKVLVVVYTNTFTDSATAQEIEDLWGEVDEAVEFFWRSSRLRLHVAADRLVIDRLLTREQLWEVTEDHYWLPQWKVDGAHSVRDDLTDLGYTEESYDSVVVFYAWENGEGHRSQYGGASYGVGSLLGKATYAAIPLAWDPAKFNRYFEHEFMHNVRSIFQNSGYSSFPDIHSPQNQTGVYDDDDTWYAWILAGIPDEPYTGPRSGWGEVRSCADVDGDGLADTSPEGDTLPITEALLGTSPVRVDTDGDGSSDLDEVTAAVRRGTDPTNPDSDADGVPDGEDATPFDAVTTLVADGTPAVDGTVFPGVYTPIASFGDSNPAEASADLWMAWDSDFVYFAVNVTDDFVATPWTEPRFNDSVTLRIDAQSDGFLHQGDGNYLIRAAPKGPEDDPTRTVEIWRSDKSFDKETVAPESLPAAYTVLSNGWRIEVAVPASKTLGLQPVLGGTIRLQVELQDYDGMRPDGWSNYRAFESFTLLTFDGEDCNENGILDALEPDCNENGVPDDCDLAAGTSTDLNQNGLPDDCDPACAAALGPRPSETFLAGGTRVVAFAGAIAHSGTHASEDLTWTGVQLRNIGAGDASSLAKQARLYLDVNPGGVIDENDKPLGDFARFEPVDQRIALKDFAVTIPRGGSLAYVLVLELAEEGTAGTGGGGTHTPPVVFLLAGVWAAWCLLRRRGAAWRLAGLSAVLLAASLAVFPGCGSGGGDSAGSGGSSAAAGSADIQIEVIDLDVEGKQSKERAIVEGLPLAGYEIRL